MEGMVRYAKDRSKFRKYFGNNSDTSFTNPYGKVRSILYLGF